MDKKKSLKWTNLRVLFGGLQLSDDKAIDDDQFEKYSEDNESFLSKQLQASGRHPTRSQGELQQPYEPPG